MELSDTPKTVADRLVEAGAQVNSAQCVEFKGYWAVDYLLGGQRSRVSYSEGQLAIERLVPIMQSGHQADWYSVRSQKGVSENAVASEAVKLVLACQMGGK